MKYLKESEHVTGFGIGLSYNPLSLVSLAIVNVTRGILPIIRALREVPSHAFEVYRIFGRNESTRFVFFEMTFGGYRGPIPLAQKDAWVDARRWRSYEIRWLYIQPVADCETKFTEALEWSKAGYPYDLRQLYKLWKQVRLHRPLTQADPEKGTCSEVAAIRAMPQYDFRRGSEVFDVITPFNLKKRTAET